jgi:hypothetical protein
MKAFALISPFQMLQITMSPFWWMFLWYNHSLALKIHLLRYPAGLLSFTPPFLSSIEPLIVLTTIKSTNINALVTQMEFLFYPSSWSQMASFTQLPNYFSKT